MNFNPPAGAGNFTALVQRRVLDLIECGLWDIPLDRYHGWLRGFTTGAEQYFASCLLDSLIYRTSPQFSATLAALFHGPCVTACGLTGDVELVEVLRQRRPDPGVRLVPVICDADPPSKSGPMVMRRLAKLLGIRDQWMVWPWQIADAIREDGVHTILLVDDFLGSGKQFETFCGKEDIQKAVGAVRAVYAPAVAHEDGIIRLKTFWPQLVVVAAETLTQRHNFFSPERWSALSDSQISADAAKAFYLELLPRTGFSGQGKLSALGVGDLALSYGAAHGTPNNTLPIFWYEQDASWCALLER